MRVCQLLTDLLLFASGLIAGRCGRFRWMKLGPPGILSKGAGRRPTVVFWYC